MWRENILYSTLNKKNKDVHWIYSKCGLDTLALIYLLKVFNTIKSLPYYCEKVKKQKQHVHLTVPVGRTA